MVETGGLENRCAGNRTGGSNPSPSATLMSWPRKNARQDVPTTRASPIVQQGRRSLQTDCKRRIHMSFRDDGIWRERNSLPGAAFSGREVPVTGAASDLNAVTWSRSSRSSGTPAWHARDRYVDRRHARGCKHLPPEPGLPGFDQSCFFLQLLEVHRLTRREHGQRAAVSAQPDNVFRQFQCRFQRVRLCQTVTLCCLGARGPWFESSRPTPFPFAEVTP